MHCRDLAVFLKVIIIGDIMKKKILFINPRNQSKSSLGSGKIKFPPLAFGILAALTPDNFEIQLIDENIKSFIYTTADLVCFTGFTATINRAYEISRIYKKKNILTIGGGIHVSLNYDEAKNYFDSVVVGEAENIWAKVIEDFEKKQLQPKYENNEEALSNFPIPRHDIFGDKYSYSSIQTARGCPFDCNFCSVTTFNGKSTRTRPIEDILKEIETIPKNKSIFFVDDNLIGYSKSSQKRAIDLFKAMIDSKFKHQWFCQASMNIAEDDEVLEYAAKSGCITILIGIEAEDDKALKAINKTINQKIGVNKFKHVFAKIHNFGINVVGCFIYGTMNDNAITLKNRTNYIINSKINFIQMTCLTPLPGTKLFKEMSDKGLLLYNNFPKDWEYYDFCNLVFKHPSFEPEEFNTIIKESANSIFSHFENIKRAFRTLLVRKNVRGAIMNLAMNYIYGNSIKNRKIK